MRVEHVAGLLLAILLLLGSTDPGPPSQFRTHPVILQPIEVAPDKSPTVDQLLSHVTKGPK